MQKEIIFFYYTVGYSLVAYYYFLTHPVSFSDFIFYLKIILLCSLLYVFVEMIFSYVPFTSKYYFFMWNEDGYSSRYSGALGSSLMFCGLGILSILTFIMNYKKHETLDYWLFILGALCIFFSASRTGFILLGVSILMLFYFLYQRKEIKKMFGFIVFFVLIAFILQNLYLEQIDLILERTSSLESKHRSASYEVSWMLFEKNILGYGGGAFQEIQSGGYSLPKGFNKNFETFDNSLLSLLVRFGVFVFLPLSLYCFLLFVKRGRQKGTGYFLLALLLMSFSFQVEFYICVNYLFFAAVAFWGNDVQKKIC